MYAHLTGGTIDIVSALPATYFDGQEWHDWRGPAPWRTDPADAGWFFITPTPRPDDTPLATFTESVTVVDGLPVQTWTQRLLTPGEITSRSLSANRDVLVDDTADELSTLRATIDDLMAVLTGARGIIGPTGAQPGHDSFRELLAQPNNDLVATASVRAAFALLIDLTSLVVDEAQATRTVARQVVRLAQDMAGDYTSTDVGPP